MDDKNPDLEKDLLEEADRLAAEVEADIAAHKFDETINVSGGEITPEMLENMDPAQLQAFIAAMAQQKKRFYQSRFTRKSTPKNVRKMKRKAAKKARLISSRNGNGKCIPRAKRRKNAA